ncbi:hypothetical protein H8E88_29275 [candidate division KSB1 bacterium]|nr:hypothetical protein [candidate division KSB1 bacterium]MBL7094644.1 hypothetical protein [candidate division KSB1 bacterium]
MAKNVINEIVWTRVRSFRKEYKIEGIATQLTKLFFNYWILFAVFMIIVILND